MQNSAPRRQICSLSQFVVARGTDSDSDSRFGLPLPIPASLRRLFVASAAVLDVVAMMAVVASSDYDNSILLFFLFLSNALTATTTDQAPLKHPFSVFCPAPPEGCFRGGLLLIPLLTARPWNILFPLLRADDNEDDDDDDDVS